MARVLGAGGPGSAAGPGLTDEVAVSAQPGLGLGASLPTAGVIMPMPETDRPWWLVPSLAVGGTLLVAVVALLAVLLLQPTGASRQGGGDVARYTASANTYAPTPSPARVPDRVVSKIASKQLAAAVPLVTRTPSVQRPRAKKEPRARLVHPRKRRPRRDRKTVVRPVVRAVVRAVGEPKVTRPHQPRQRPRSIAEILVVVGKTRPGKTRPGAPKVAPRVSLPAKLGRRSIQAGMSSVLGAARACGRRFSTTGRVSVRLVITGATGRVQSAAPKGSHATSLTGRCVARALQSARFKPFARARQSLYYTVILR